MYQTILILPGGEEISSGGGQKNAIRQLQLTQRVNAGEELTCGSVCAAMAQLQLITPGGGLTLQAGDEIQLLRQQEGRRHPLGRFILENPTRPTADTLNLTAYDFVTKLDQDVTAWLQTQAFPMTAAQLAKGVCEACGLELAAEVFTNQDHPIAALSGSYTARQLMGHIAQLAGGFCRADSEGRIVIGYYEDKGREISAEACFRRGLIREDYTVTPVTGAHLQLGSCLWPEAGENPYILEGNPLLAANEEGAAALQNLASRIPGGYTPCSLTVAADPGIEPGEILAVTDGNGQRFTALVMEKQTRGQKALLTCTGSRSRLAAPAIHTAAPKLTQKELFDKLTGGGEAKGLFLQDGQLYINASYLAAGVIDAAVVQVVNLVAEKLRSAAEHSEVIIDGGQLALESGGNSVASLESMADETGALPILYMTDRDAGANPIHRLELTPHHIRMGGADIDGGFGFRFWDDGSVSMSLGQEDTPKTLYWHAHSDGSYSLRGK